MAPLLGRAGGGGLSAETLRDWYYREANGLLLSGDALRVFVALRDGLAGESTDAELRDLATALRTELKIDLGTRHPDERHVRFARPLDRMVS